MILSVRMPVSGSTRFTTRRTEERGMGRGTVRTRGEFGLAMRAVGEGVMSTYNLIH